MLGRASGLYEVVVVIPGCMTGELLPHVGIPRLGVLTQGEGGHGGLGGHGSDNGGQHAQSGATATVLFLNGAAQSGVPGRERDELNLASQATSPAYP